MGALFDRLLAPVALALPWRILLVLALVTAGAGLGYLDGARHVHAQWAAADARRVADTARQVATLQQQARDTEARHAQALADISTHYQETLHALDTRRAADRAALQSGALRLRDPGAPVRNCDRPAAPSATAPGGGDGAASGGLSGAAAGFLLDFADDADRVAEQLGACQRALRGDRG